MQSFWGGGMKVALHILSCYLRETNVSIGKEHENNKLEACIS